MLSLSITRVFLDRVPKKFKPSKVTPFVKDPSPTTAITLPLSPCNDCPTFNPAAEDTAVPACPVLKISVRCSSGAGNPLRPPSFLKELNNSYLPVSILCV